MFLILESIHASGANQYELPGFAELMDVPPSRASEIIEVLIVLSLINGYGTTANSVQWVGSF